MPTNIFTYGSASNLIKKLLIYSMNYIQSSILPSKLVINLAGFPPTIVLGATFLVTTEPAATTEFSPTLIPGRIVAL